ncbi:Maltose/galactoside acetyltransferase [Penicillium robsamsonii]|uniref:Maltose/galactoside acetyltransferase n=1 Tax=Penicillium robsamsonii TaxID=1792511 RepID=UPI0025467919|nr:Maltose/galactoside acetyltransferase [Penicillium robsamsonii]KAJ5817440.1 Maltose/galactoside acetyltransferase [Penicillium robsamsonii]
MTNGPFSADRSHALYQSFGRTLPPSLNSVPDEVRSEGDIPTIRDVLSYEAVRTEADIAAVLDALTYDIGLRFLAEAVRKAPASDEIAVYAEVLTHRMGYNARRIARCGNVSTMISRGHTVGLWWLTAHLHRPSNQGHSRRQMSQPQFKQQQPGRYLPSQ